MKKIIFLSVVILCVFLVNVSLAGRYPKRKTNFDGNISVEKLEIKSKLKSNTVERKAILTIASNAHKTNFPKLIRSSNYFDFFDAKFDEKSNLLVVVYFGGMYLKCDYYKQQNDKWVLLKEISVIDYDSYMQICCKEVKLVDMNTIEIILDSEGAGTTKKGVERTYLITINDKYEVEKINGKTIDKLKLGTPILLDYVSIKDLTSLGYKGNYLQNRIKQEKENKK